MKISFCFLQFIFFQFAFSLISFAQDSPQQYIDTFFREYEKKGAKVAVDNLYKTNPWTSRIEDGINNVKNKLAEFDEELVGKYYGSVFIDKVETAGCFAIYTYFMKFDRQPLRLTFKFYKPDQKWILHSFKFDDSFDEDIEKALIWRYSGKE